jgi:hypothetical protein
MRPGRFEHEAPVCNVQAASIAGSHVDVERNWTVGLPERNRREYQVVEKLGCTSSESEGSPGELARVNSRADSGPNWLAPHCESTCRH